MEDWLRHVKSLEGEEGIYRMEERTGFASTGYAKLHYEQERDTRGDYPLSTHIYNSLNKNLFLPNSLRDLLKRPQFVA